MFGGASKPTPSFNFGGSSSTQSNEKPFSFGGSQSQSQAQEKPFSFGGASSQNTGGTSSMFSPEQPTKQASVPSFNFGGAGVSQPSSQTNMFGGNSNSQRYVDAKKLFYNQPSRLVLDLISAVTTRAPLLLEEICSETPVAVQRPHHLSILEAEVLRTTLKAQASILAETLASLHR